MALVTCPDCQAQVSDAAPACIRCGRPLANRTPAVRHDVHVAVGGGGNVVAAIASFFLPGLGQVAQGRVGAGAFFFFVTALVWVVTIGLLGWVGHVTAAIDAAMWKGPKPIQTGD